jgi:hypothetical protein
MRYLTKRNSLTPWQGMIRSKSHFATVLASFFIALVFAISVLFNLVIIVTQYSLFVRPLRPSKFLMCPREWSEHTTEARQLADTSSLRVLLLWR